MKSLILAALLLAVSSPVFGQNIAKGKLTAASSSQDASYPATYATDSNTFTRWSSAYRDGESITVDLQANYQISRVKLTWEDAYASAYLLEASVDGSTWVSIYSINNNAVKSNDLNIDGTGRYIRLTCTTRVLRDYGCSLWEFEVYGSAVAATPPLVYQPYAPPMYPMPWGQGSDWKSDTLNPRGQDPLVHDGVAAWWYNDGFTWTCYGVAGNPSNWIQAEIHDGMNALAALKAGDRSLLDAFVKTKVNRFLTADEAALRDSLCSTIAKQPLVYVVKGNGSSTTRPAYGRNVDGSLSAKKLGDVQTFTACDCSSADKRILGASLYCSVAGSSIVGTRSVFPANAVSICAKQ